MTTSNVSATRPVSAASVIGAGTMGQGIAICFAQAGIPVQLLDLKQENLTKADSAIRKVISARVRRGTLSQEVADTVLQSIRMSTRFEDSSEADIFIEAVFEDLETKQRVFRQLDAIAKTGAILASNTSYLDIDAIASATSRPGDVVGTHFFSPAHVMKLVEVVRGTHTRAEVQLAAQQVCETLGKTVVLTGNCEGFVGNRMLAKRTREVYFLLEEGATPWQIDQAFVDFGFPMGPLAVGDLAGLDVGWRARQARLASLTERERACTILDQLCDLGRFGQKTGAGFYRYDEQRRASADPEIEALIVRHSEAVKIERRSIEAREIIDRCLFAMINEGARILEERIVSRASDIDKVWLYGYGFPQSIGGPMKYADRIGLGSVYERILSLRNKHGAEYWTPAPLLERLAKDRGGFYDV